LLATIVLLAILSAVIITAYVNGQKVVDDPKVLWVSHTEYWSSTGPGSDEVASTIVRIMDYKGQAYAMDSCTANIYYPDKSAYVSDGAMSQSPVSGNWYRTDPVPAQEGTYEQEVTCLYGAGKSIKTSQSFHVNPALNFIKNVSTQVLAADTYLHAVNVSITGSVATAQAELSSQMSSADSNLTALLTQMETDLTTEIEESEANLNTSLSNVNVEIQATIADTEDVLVARVDVAETNLTTLINQVNTELQAQLADHNASAGSQFSDLEVSVQGMIDDAKTEILAAIDASETDLTVVMDSIESNLSTQMTNMNVDLDTKLTNVNISITTQLTEAQTAIQTQLTSAETNLDSAISSTENTIMSYLQDFLPDINDTVTDIYADSQWLVSNAMDVTDYAAILARFDTIDGDIDQLQEMCGSVLTQDSDLCTEIEALQTTLDATRAEQTAYFNTLNSTTTSTWDLLSGDITTNINTALTELGIIRGQTEDINATVHAIRDDQTERVYIQMIA